MIGRDKAKDRHGVGGDLAGTQGEAKDGQGDWANDRQGWDREGQRTGKVGEYDVVRYAI